jgi:hypothetical protein
LTNQQEKYLLSTLTGSLGITKSIDNIFKSACMCLLLKAATMPGLKKRITLAAEPLVQTESHLLFNYYIDGKMRFLEVEIGEDAAELFEQNGLISRYEGAGHNLTLYVKKLHTVVGKDGAPVQWVSEVETEWHELKIFHSDMLHIVANHEYDLIGRVMGLIPYKPKAKVRHIGKYNVAV